jgi:type II secretory pathway component PulM
MRELLRKWNKLGMRQRMLLAAAAALVVLVGAQRVPVALFSLPFPRAAERNEQELEQVRTRLAKAQDRYGKQQTRIKEIKHTAGQILWQFDAGNPSVELQKVLEQLARKAGVTISSMGSPRTDDISKNVRSVEVPVSLSGTIYEIGRFLLEVHNAPARLEWTSCSIRNPNPQASNTVTLNGRVAGCYAAPSAAAAIVADSGRNGS